MANERTMRPAVIAWLRSNGYPSHVFESYFGHGYCDVVGFRFGERLGRPIPPLEAVCAIELKLSKIAEVIMQARTNRLIIPQSWCAMPADFVGRMRPQSLDKFKDSGVGLLSVDGSVATAVIQPLGTLREPEGEHWHAYIAKNLPRKLWRRRDEEAEAEEMAAVDALVDRAVAEL